MHTWDSIGVAVIQWHFVAPLVAEPITPLRAELHLAVVMGGDGRKRGCGLRDWHGGDVCVYEGSEWRAWRMVRGAVRRRYWMRARCLVPVVSSRFCDSRVPAPATWRLFAVVVCRSGVTASAAGERLCGVRPR